MIILVCRLCLIVYCISIIIDWSMEKKKKKKEKKERKKEQKLHLCIILYHYPLSTCMDVTPYSTEHI